MDKNARVGLALLGLLVVFLGAIVYWAMPKEGDGAGGGAGGSADASPAEADGGGAQASAKRAGRAALERLPEATCELVVLTDKPEEQVQQMASVDAVARLLDVRHCGAACDAVRKVLADKDHFEIEVQKTADYILPPRESWDVVAAGLTPQERKTIGDKPLAVVVKTHGPATIDQLPARAAFATTAALAESLGGFVYDEVVRRIETAPQTAARVITVPLGEPVFSPKQIVVQLYRQEDGTARLLTLGMVRFGSPDFTMRGSAMELGPSLAAMANAVAAYAARAQTALPVRVTIDDVTRIAARGAPAPASSAPVDLDAIEAERTEGDPENDMLELVPPGGATREAWAAAVTRLFGEAPKVVFAAFDKELEAIAARARAELPRAVKRFEAGEGALFVKGPFPIPAAARADGGPEEEWMWIEVSACDAKGCAGVLSNTPGYATNLTAGSPARVERAKTADWVLKLADGGTAGGESIRALARR